MAKGQMAKGRIKGHIKGHIKGRGSVSNEESRFLPTKTVAVDDGWNQPGEQLPTSPNPATQLYVDRTKRLITRNKSPDIPFDQSINPYKGCEHGCIYCYARPTHAYLDLSPGLDFETKIFRKSDPRLHLEEELAKSNYVCSVIAMGTNTDPYQPLERSQGVTREILETLLEYKHPVSIVTKSTLVLRDLDLLVPLAEMGLVHVNVSVTTLDSGLKTKLEPRTAGPAARLRTIAELRAAGVPTGAMVAPIIPFINDQEIEALVGAVAGAGAMAARYVLLRLPLEVKPLMEEWLAHHFPQRADRVMAAIRETRGGKAYRSGWHKRMVGEGQIAELIAARFRRAVKANGLTNDRLSPLHTNLFIPPPLYRPERKVQVQRAAKQASDKQFSLF